MSYLTGTRNFTLTLVTLAIVALLAGCNEIETESESADDDTSQGDNGDDTDNNGGESGGGTSSVVLDVGTGQQDDFTSGEILVGSGSVTDLSSNGEVDVEVRLVDTNDGNRLVEGSEYTVRFGSICAGREPSAAEFKPAEASVTNGIARTRYIDRGCGNVRGDEPDSIYAVVVDESVSASASLNVLPTSVGRIEVNSISATDISYREGVVIGGQTLPLQSEVVFKVVSAQGDPIPNREVSFEPASEVGGIEVAPSEGVTDDFGMVRTYLYSGRVNSSVSVIATHKTDDDVEFSTSSKAIAMHTGYPTQAGFSLYADIYNPNASNYEGVPVEVKATLSDRFGNYGPETEIVFSSKRGGRIAGSCTTEADGDCVVTWLSDPDSAESSLIHVTALTEGEGDFKDQDGDGLFDPVADGDTDHGVANTAKGCDLSQESTANAEGFCSYPEAHFETTGRAPDLMTGDYSFAPGIEEFSDWNNSGDWNDRPGFYQGVRCTDAAIDAGHCAETLQLRQYISIVLSSDGVPTFENPSYGQFNLGDTNENTLPIGTAVSGSCEEGDFVEETWVSPVPNQFKTDLTGYTYSTVPTDDGALRGCEVTVEIDDRSYRISVTTLAEKLEPEFENDTAGEFSLTSNGTDRVRLGSTVEGECEVGDFVKDDWASPVFDGSDTDYTYATDQDADGNEAENCAVTAMIGGVAYEYPVRVSP